MLAGRAAALELPREAPEMVQGAGGQEQLPAKDAERQGRPRVPPQNSRPRHAIRLEKVGHGDSQRLGHSPQRFDAGTRAAPLDLAQEALAEPRARGDRPERAATEAPQLPEALTDVDLSRHVGSARRHSDLLGPRRRKTEATLWCWRSRVNATVSSLAVDSTSACPMIEDCRSID